MCPIQNFNGVSEMLNLKKLSSKISEIRSNSNYQLKILGNSKRPLFFINMVLNMCPKTHIKTTLKRKRCNKHQHKLIFPTIVTILNINCKFTSKLLKQISCNKPTVFIIKNV